MRFGFEKNAFQESTLDYSQLYQKYTKVLPNKYLANIRSRSRKIGGFYNELNSCQTEKIKNGLDLSQLLPQMHVLFTFTFAKASFDWPLVELLL